MQEGWTVLFFIYAEDKETQSYAKALITTLRKAKHNESLTLLVFESFFSSLGGGMITGKLSSLEFDAERNTRRLHLEHDFGEVNPGSKSVLARVLRHIRDNELLRKKFLLFTWDHGTGFGIFDGDPTRHTEDLRAFLPQSLGLEEPVKKNPEPEEIKEPGNIEVDDFDPANSDIKVIANARTRALIKTQPQHVKFSFDEVLNIQFEDPGGSRDRDVQIDMLTFSEINEALKVLGMKTELVIMLNCWMQMLENSFEVEETVEWLVAAETVHFFAGYDYEKIINRIADDPGVTGENVARTAVETLPGVFNSDPMWKKHLRELIVTAVKPGSVRAVVNALDTICLSLKDQVPGSFKDMVKTRGDCLDLSKGYFLNEDKTVDLSALIFCIDLVNYIALLANQGLVTEESLNNLRKEISRYKKFEFIGDKFRKTNFLTGLPFGHGISIFHPDKKEDFDDIVFYDFFYASKRIKMSRAEWGKFLGIYKKNR